MRVTNIVWTTAIIAAAVVLTAVLSTASVKATVPVAPDQEFIATMKTGRVRGKGRPVLPPMPVQNLANLTDSDIRALFAYLQSLPAIKNRTPQPIEPGDQR